MSCENATLWLVTDFPAPVALRSFFYPHIASSLSPILLRIYLYSFLFFRFPSTAIVLHAPHSSSVYPPQTALASSGGLYCLHGCAVNI